jgi:hypothetical protein
MKQKKMSDLNFKLRFATLIPDFIYQFLSNELIDNDVFTCFELEDVRNTILNVEMDDLKNIKKILMITGDDDKTTNQNTDENIMENLDYELNEVNNEYFHRYTIEELKYIFKEIIFNIDTVYHEFKKWTGTNLILTIGFKFKNGLETNMVVEFLESKDNKEYIGNVFFLPMENYFVSDNIIARLYFYIDDKKFPSYEKQFKKIVDCLNLKETK